MKLAKLAKAKSPFQFPLGTRRISHFVSVGAMILSPTTLQTSRLDFDNCSSMRMLAAYSKYDTWLLATLFGPTSVLCIEYKLKKAIKPQA